MHVSIILCTYGGDPYGDFAEAAESVLNQTYSEVELVIVVDGPDPVADRVQAEFGDRKDVIVHVNDTNVGLLQSRNTGAELATGDIVAFLDADAVADPQWVEQLVSAYEEHDIHSVGGRMTPEWVAGKPAFLPEEFYWLVGVTHRGFAAGAGEVRNTFGSNISFRRDVFLELGGFDPEIGGRQGDANLQGGETELCARLRDEYGRGVWYVPGAEVAHKVYDYRTDPLWLIDRAFWQGYSKRAMETLTPSSGAEETEFLGRLLTRFLPAHLKQTVVRPSYETVSQLVMLLFLTGTVGLGYLYGFTRYR